MKKVSEITPKKKNRLWIAALVVTVIAILFHFALQSGFFDKILAVFEPIFIGIALAYLLNPLVKLLERLFFKLFGKRAKKPGKLRKFCRILSIFLTLILAIGLIALIVYMIVPQLYNTTAGLIKELPSMIDNTSEWYNQTVQGNDTLRSVGESALNGLKSWFNAIDTKTILNTLSVAYSAVRTLINVIVGFILAVYLLYSRETLCAQTKRLFYAFFDNDKVNAFLRTTREGHKIMSRFIIGKLIDSAIIGVLCFIAMLILRLPYALLVSVIVGVTNVIPYFGPFIGGIPSALLILLTDPLQGLIFIIMILVLQQIDGNLIGPKILGDRIGLSPFWVMFAIIVGGGLFGFPGMLLGVPVLAIIFFVVGQISDRRLTDKKMPVAVDAYIPEGDYAPPVTDEETESDEQI